MPNEQRQFADLITQLKQNQNHLGLPSKDKENLYHTEQLDELRKIRESISTASTKELNKSSALLEKIEELIKKDTSTKTSSKDSKKALTGTTRDTEKGGKKRLSGTTEDADKQTDIKSKSPSLGITDKARKAGGKIVDEAGMFLPLMTMMTGIFGDTLTKGWDAMKKQLLDIVTDPKFLVPAGLGGAYAANKLKNKFFPKKKPPTSKPPTPKPKTPKPPKPLTYRVDPKTGKTQVKAKSGDFYDVDKPQGKTIETRGGTQKIDDAVKQRPKNLSKSGKPKTTGTKTDKIIDAAKKTASASKGAAKTGLRAVGKALGPLGIFIEAGFTVSDAIDLMSDGSGEKLEAYRKQFDESSPVWKAITAISSPAYFSAMMGENIAEWMAGDYKTDIADKKMTKPKARRTGRGGKRIVQPSKSQLKEYEDWKKAVAIKNKKIDDIVKWTAGWGEPLLKTDLLKLPYKMVVGIWADLYNQLGGDKVLNPEKYKEVQEQKQKAAAAEKIQHDEDMAALAKKFTDSPKSITDEDMAQLEDLRKWNNPSNPYYDPKFRGYDAPPVINKGGDTVNITTEAAPATDKYNGKDN